MAWGRPEAFSSAEEEVDEGYLVNHQASALVQEGMDVDFLAEVLVEVLEGVLEGPDLDLVVLVEEEDAAV